MRKNTLFGNIEEKNYSFKRERKKKRQAGKKFQFCLRSPLPRIFPSSIDAITISYNI